jgi:hypothetical protein
MATNDAGPQPQMKRGNVLVQAGQPLQFTEIVGADTTKAPAESIGNTIGATLKAYQKAAQKLLEGKYIGQREFAPPNMRRPCNIFVLRCRDGIFVRYDLAPQKEAKMRCAQLDASLTEVAPQFSDQVVHFPPDPKTYVPGPGGVELALMVSDPKTGTCAVQLKLRPMIYATLKLPEGFQIPPPPARPSVLRLSTAKSIFSSEESLNPPTRLRDPPGPILNSSLLMAGPGCSSDGRRSRSTRRSARNIGNPNTSQFGRNWTYLP